MNEWIKNKVWVYLETDLWSEFLPREIMEDHTRGAASRLYDGWDDGAAVGEILKYIGTSGRAMASDSNHRLHSFLSQSPKLHANFNSTGSILQATNIDDDNDEIPSYRQLDHHQFPINPASHDLHEDPSNNLSRQHGGIFSNLSSSDSIHQVRLRRSQTVENSIES